MSDRYAKKKDKIADLLFDLVKYLLTTVGAIVLLLDKPIRPIAVIAAVVLAIIIFMLAVLITPLKED